MNRKSKIAFAVIGLLLTGLMSCQKKEQEPSVTRYNPTARALISRDRGKSWIENMKDIEVNEIFYLRIEVSIKTDTIGKVFHDDQIQYTIAIPGTEVMDCKLLTAQGEGINQTPASDSVTNLVKYNFTAIPNDPQKQVVEFQCRAKVAGLQEIRISYGPQVNSSHMQLMTMVYNEPENKE